MNNLKLAFIASIQKHPFRYLCFSLILFLMTTPGLFLIQQDFSYRVWYSSQDPLLQVYDNFERKFGNDDNLIIGVFNDKGLYNPESIKLISDLTKEVWNIDGVMRVDSLTNFDYISSHQNSIDISPLVDEQRNHLFSSNEVEELRSKVQKHNYIEGNYISQDGKLAVIIAQISPFYGKLADNSLITSETRALVAKYSDKDHKFQICGTSVLTHLFKEITEQDMGILLPLVYIIFTVVLWLIYKRKSGILIPYLIVSVSILMMMGISSYLGHKLNSLSGVAPNILLTVAIADTIHILTVYFFGLKQGFSNHAAVKYSLSKNFYPTLLTTLTTAVGFFSFAGAKIGPIAQMGIDVGFGVILAWICSYTVIGPILQLMPKIKKRQDHHQGMSVLEAEVHQAVSDKTKKHIQLIYHNKKYILGSALALILLSVFISSRYLIINLDPYSQFPTGYPFIQDLKKIEMHLGPIDKIDLMINTHHLEGAKDPLFLRKVDEFEKWLNIQDYITRTFSINDILKDINKTLNQNSDKYYTIPASKEEIGQALLFYSLGLPAGRDLNNRINLQNDSIRLTAHWNIHTSKEANQKIKEIENKARDFGLDLVTTGKVPLFHDLTPYVVTSFLESFSLAFILITIILVFVLKSWRLGLLALIPNLFPLILGAALYGLSGEYVDMASVLIASVCLGIAVDDSIHFLFEYKKYRKLNYNPIQTVELIYTNTAPSLINTTVIIMLGFGSFYFAQYVPNAKFGVMVSIILFLAILADLYLLPAILFLTDKGQSNK